jgi:hypothetical protein
MVGSINKSLTCWIQKRQRESTSPLALRDVPSAALPVPQNLKHLDPKDQLAQLDANSSLWRSPSVIIPQEQEGKDSLNDREKLAKILSMHSSVMTIKDENHPESQRTTSRIILDSLELNEQIAVRHHENGLTWLTLPGGDRAPQTLRNALQHIAGPVLVRRQQRFAEQNQDAYLLHLDKAAGEKADA